MTRNFHFPLGWAAGTENPLDATEPVESDMSARREKTFPFGATRRTSTGIGAGARLNPLRSST